MASEDCDWPQIARCFRRSSPVEQFDILRQIADVLPRAPRATIDRKRRAVQADFAAHRLPDADEQPRKTRFAGAAWADDAEAAAGIEGEIDVACDEPLNCPEGQRLRS